MEGDSRSAIALLAGALFTVRAMPDRVPTWITATTLLAMVPLVPLVELRARRWDRPAPLVILLAVVGAYVCVPDTEFLRPLVAASLVVALLALVPGRAVTQIGAGTVAGLLLWTIGIGGEGRTGSLVGGMACVAALALFPSLPDRRPLRRSWWVAAGVTALLVLWCARVAGLVGAGWLSFLIVTAGFLVAIAVRVTLGRDDSRRHGGR